MEVEPDADNSAVLARHRRDQAVLAVVFLLLFAFSYSEDFVFAVLQATGHEHVAGWLIGLVGFDAAVLAVVGLLKRAIAPTMRHLNCGDGGGSRSPPSLV